MRPLFPLLHLFVFRLPLAFSRLFFRRLFRCSKYPFGFPLFRYYPSFATTITTERPLKRSIPLRAAAGGSLSEHSEGSDAVTTRRPAVQLRLLIPPLKPPS